MKAIKEEINSKFQLAKQDKKWKGGILSKKQTF